MLVPVWRDRTQKPPMGVPLRSDGHWSVQGLVGTWAFNEGAGQQFHDCAGRFVGSIGAQSWNPEGLLVNYLGTKPTIGSLPLPTGPFTVVIGVKINGIDSGTPSQIFGKRSAFNSSDGCAVWCGYGGPTDVSFSLNNYRATSSTNTLKVGKYHVLVGRFGGTAISIYCDGVKKAETTFTGTPTDNANSFSMLQFGGGTSYFVYDAIGFYLCALSPAQIASLSANPWQIYEPELTFIETDPKIFQSYYRFRNDDGSETSATWIEGENTVITKPADSDIRLRLSLESQGNPAPKNLQLEYRRVGDVDWKKVTL